MPGTAIISNLGICIVMVLLGLSGLYCLLRRLKREQKFNRHALQVISSVSLGHKEKLIVVHWEQQRILLGVTPHSINALHVMERKKKTSSLSSIALERSPSFDECLIQETPSRG